MNGIVNIARRQASSSGGAAPANPDFVSTWDTTQAGSASDTVVLPLLSGGTYSGTIDWGDGGATSTLSYANRTHVYASSGTYTITISGTIEGWQFNNGGDRRKITDISNWGNLTITTNRAFFGCSNLDISATDAPNITTTSTYLMFRNCSSLTTPDFSLFDVSGVTNMQGMFQMATLFNGDVTTWDVSGVSTGNQFREMFFYAASFNQNIGGWNTAALSNISYMLYNADSFDQNIGGWDWTNITFANSFMQLATGLSTANYDSTLVGIEANLQAAYPNGSGYTASINIHFGGSQYSNALMNVGEARYNLLNVFGWTITDGGGV